MSKLISAVLAAVSVLAAPIALAGSLDAWGAYEVACDVAVGPACSPGWAAITDAQGDLTVDMGTLAVSLDGNVWTDSGPYAVRFEGVLVDADANFSGNARMIVGGELIEVMLKRTAAGGWKLGGEALGFYVRSE